MCIRDRYAVAVHQHALHAPLTTRELRTLLAAPFARDHRGCGEGRGGLVCAGAAGSVSYTHLRAHETLMNL
eukprot:7262229-Prymnesium_polylepis.1